MYSNNPLVNIDFYKVDHRRQYPKGLTEVYSNLTPRSFIPGDNLPTDFDKRILWVGIQQTLQTLMHEWNKWFDSSDSFRTFTIVEYRRFVEESLGLKNFDFSHLIALSNRGCLPVSIKTLPEGSLVPIGCPVLTIRNLEPEFAWLTNYLETYLSAQIWKTPTVATISLQYRRLLEKYASDTCEYNFHVPYQGHDFSYRGMSGTRDAATSGIGHLACFKGSDNVPAIIQASNCYYAYSDIASSVPATEHSVMCMGTKEGEKDTYERLLDLYPEGYVSIVSDTWDLWNVLDNILPALKTKILARNGKLVIRPDSGDPVTITLQVIEKLANVFGFVTNKKGYKELNPKVGVIYGDSITYKRAEIILAKMKELGWASNNVVFGIGSYTYQYLTRDTFGWAIKATNGTKDGVDFPIYKDPITDDGKKKSLMGLIKVGGINGAYRVKDNVSRDQEKRGWLKEVFSYGRLSVGVTLEEIRKKVDEYV